jgi:hypothetical protein
MEELDQPLFLYVDPALRPIFEQAEPLFGEAVSVAFPEASRDLAAAGRCLALDEWTASVIHLMRALEFPLHALADRIGVTFPNPIDLENWKNIIDQMQSKIEADVRALEQKAKSHERNDRLEWLGKVVLPFRHFKNAWRNNAAHGRDHYDEREARQVWDNVKSFMQTMAAA